MEFLILAMMVAAGTLAVAAIAVVQFLDRADRRTPPIPATDDLAASIIFHVLAAGDVQRERAVEVTRTYSRGRITRAIDLRSWAEAYARRTGFAEALHLLESATAAAASVNRLLPLAQYNALLDLAFALGFQTDALARLRSRFQFEYVDYAKHSRPRSADRGESSMPLFQRVSVDRHQAFSVLGLAPPVSRRDLIVAYRRRVSEQHPDRFHDQPAAAQEEAAAEFRRIHQAYNSLLREIDALEEGSVLR